MFVFCGVGTVTARALPHCHRAVDKSGQFAELFVAVLANQINPGFDERLTEIAFMTILTAPFGIRFMGIYRGLRWSFERQYFRLGGIVDQGRIHLDHLHGRRQRHSIEKESQHPIPFFLTTFPGKQGNQNGSD